MPNAIIAIAKRFIFCYLSSSPYEKKVSIGVEQRHSFSSSFYEIFYFSIISASCSDSFSYCTISSISTVAHPSNVLNIKSQNLLKIWHQDYSALFRYSFPAAGFHSMHSQRAMEAITRSQADSESFESLINTETAIFRPLGRTMMPTSLRAVTPPPGSVNPDPVLCATT